MDYLIYHNSRLCSLSHIHIHSFKVTEASSVEEMNSLFRQLQDEPQALAQTHHSSELIFGEHNGTTDSGVPVPGANSSEDISSAFVHLRNDDDKIPGDGEVILDSVG